MAETPALEGGFPSAAEPPSSGFLNNSWLQNFTNRDRRRGSVGFNNNAAFGTTPPCRIDEDSNSMSDLAAVAADSAAGVRIAAARSRSNSIFNVQTPSMDQDLYSFANRIKNIQQQQQLTEEEKPVEPAGGAVLKLTQNGAIQLNMAGREEESEADSRTAAADDWPVMSVVGGPQHNNLPDLLEEAANDSHEGSSIFLVDLETVQAEDDQSLTLKPEPKKYFASKIFNSWFFRRGEEEDGEHEDEPMEVERPILSKMRQAVQQHPAIFREMNTWQPQNL